MNPWFDTVSPGYFSDPGDRASGWPISPRAIASAPLASLWSTTFSRITSSRIKPHRPPLQDSAAAPRPISRSSAWCAAPSTPRSMRRSRERSTCRSRRTRTRVPWWSTHARRAIRRPSSPSLRRDSKPRWIPASPSPTCAPWKIRSTSRSPRSARWPALSVFFGILATLLAAIGLYGVMAYTVTRRTREIGIRLALGAGRASLLTLVLREVALLTAAGVAIAIPVALAVTRLVRSELYGIVPNDPFSIASAAVVLACSGSARRLHPCRTRHPSRPHHRPPLRVDDCGRPVRAQPVGETRRASVRPTSPPSSA